uniref:Uncharacterized protein n=1 Tax=Micrurus lemniscatus lemniscatus TaxID=129467 RepID=A0A2D4I4X4_MICLE
MLIGLKWLWTWKLKGLVVIYSYRFEFQASYFKQTGLTPLMEAASGGYAEVGRVLLDKGADVNAPPVPSSRDTALTIAADKGHYKFCELLINRYSIFCYIRIAQFELHALSPTSLIWPCSSLPSTT